MQAWSGQPPTGTGTSTLSPARKFLTTVLIVCSLIGLIAGFAVGGLTGAKGHPTTTGNTGPVKKPTQIVQQTVVVTPSPTPEDIQLSPPNIINYNYSETADGTTSYTLSAQPIDKSTGKAVSVADVTCRLWLTKDTDATDKALRASNYALLVNIGGFTQPFPQEVASSLSFTAPSLQVQNCVANGPTTWTYTLAPTVQPGTYYLYVLSDWKGKHYNWYARQIQVRA